MGKRRRTTVEKREGRGRILDLWCRNLSGEVVEGFHFSQFRDLV